MIDSRPQLFLKAMISTTTEIEAPPSIVRGVVHAPFTSCVLHLLLIRSHTNANCPSQLLGIPNLRTYHSGFSEAFTPIDPSALTPGKRLYIEIGPQFVGTVTLKMPSCFEWKGSPHYGILSGVFRFEESEVPEGGTTFVHNEQSKRVLIWVIGLWQVGRMLVMTYEGSSEEEG